VRVYKTREKESTPRLGLRVDPEQAIVSALKSSAKAQSKGQQESKVKCGGWRVVRERDGLDGKILYACGRQVQGASIVSLLKLQFLSLCSMPYALCFRAGPTFFWMTPINK